ncbi:MAG: polysaccharide deacetylase family protein, partial [Gemmatimonadota bacterium]
MMMVRVQLLVAAAGLAVLSTLPVSAQMDDAVPGSPVKPVLVNLQVVVADDGDEQGLARILDLIENAGWRTTVYFSGEYAPVHPEVVKSVDSRGHQLGVFGWTAREEWAALSYDEQLDLLRLAFASVRRAAEADRPEYVADFLAEKQNVDTFRVLEELSIRSSSGFRAARGVARPFHTRYGFVGIPISAASGSDGVASATPLVDKEVLERLHESAEKWGDLLVSRFDQSTVSHEPVVCVVHAGVTGENLGYLAALERFLQHVASHNGTVVLTDDIKSLANPYIENMTVTGPTTASPGETVALTVTYTSTCWCPHYYFKSYGRPQGEWWNDWWGDLTDWVEKNAQVFFPYYGTHTFSVPIAVPNTSCTYLVRVVGRAAHSSYNAWPTPFLYEAIAHWSIEVEGTEVDVTGGLSFYEPESGEERIPQLVFARGGDQPRFEASGGNPSAVTVAITDSKGREVADLCIPISGAGPWSVEWDWSSPSWSGSNEIPIGLYRARFTVEDVGGHTSAEERSFYVVFNPAEVAGPNRFAHDETGVWFGAYEFAVGDWFHGTDKARTYALHPDDNRIFGRAIQAAVGHTSAWEAGHAVYEVEQGMFQYDLNWHANDVIDLLGETHAQCADDAAMLSALFRAIGIPAHPATGDANLVMAGWTFDTWVEALVDGPDGTRWYFFHPHEGLPVVTRSSAGSYSVASKEENDVVIMADASWSAAQVRDDLRDLEFRYFTYDSEGSIVPSSQGAGRPLAEFDFAQPWIVNLSEAYWGVPHEDPPIPEDPPVVAIALDEPAYAAGDTMHGTVTLWNPSTSDLSGEVALTVVGDVLESMLWPDVLLCEYSIAVTVTAGSSTSLAFDCPLPGDAGSHLVYTAVAVWQGERAATTFEVETSYEPALSVPTSVAQFDPFIVAVSVTNLGGGTLVGLTGTLV